MVELVFIEIKAAHQSPDRASVRVNGDKGTFHFGQLGDFPSVLGSLRNADDCAAHDLDVRRSLVRQARLGGFKALPGDLQRFPVLADCPDSSGVGFQHHGGHDVAVVGVFVQGLVNGVFKLARIGGQVHIFFRPPVNLAPLKVHDAPAQRPVRDFLVCGAQRGVDVQPAGVGFFSVLGEHQLAHRLRHVFSMHLEVVVVELDDEVLGAGLISLCCRDEAAFHHAVDDVLLPDAGPLGVADRVVGGGRLGQSGQHGSLGNRDVFQCFVKVSFGRRCKTVGPVSQKNLVHVNFQNLVFGQQVLQLEGQQNLVDFAHVVLL